VLLAYGTRLPVEILFFKFLLVLYAYHGDDDDDDDDDECMYAVRLEMTSLV